MSRDSACRSEPMNGYFSRPNRNDCETRDAVRRLTYRTTEPATRAGSCWWADDYRLRRRGNARPARPSTIGACLSLSTSSARCVLNEVPVTVLFNGIDENWRCLGAHDHSPRWQGAGLWGPDAGTSEKTGNAFQTQSRHAQRKRGQLIADPLILLASPREVKAPVFARLSEALGQTLPRYRQLSAERALLPSQSTRAQTDKRVALFLAWSAAKVARREALHRRPLFQPRP